MIYIAVFLVLIVAILLVWLIRLSRNRIERHRAKHDPSVLPSTVQDLSENRPTLSGVARDVTSHFSTRPGHHGEGEPYVPYHRRDLGAVNRVQDHNGSTTSLPAYGADSLPVPPHATYDPTRGRAGVIPLYTEAPPKYSTAVPNTNDAPVVRTL
ncbi:hypothetical protein IAU60_005202 [Kwoniella sp. DSM 27419]